MPPELSVVIVSYNTRADLHACLTATSAASPPVEIIVVDNASSDGSAQMVARDFPHVTLIQPGHNTWFCGGNNLGIDAAHGDYVLLLNPDTIPAPDAFALMLDFLRAHPDYAGVTAQLRYPDGVVQHTCSRLPSFIDLLVTQTVLQWLLFRLARRARQRLGYADQWRRDHDLNVAVVPGSCLMMRRTELRLNPDLRLYFPEEDIARRVNGRPFRFIAAARIIHREKSSTQSALATRIYFRDLVVYTRAHHGVVSAALLWLLTRPVLWGMALKRAVRK